ncbi:Hsp20/alpha crystallin family protein [Deinococcus roseus]|uniref:SHSP domain-containing protein n=1 Tax=Deinococcus roseus TaxID=392414 RepID=A0ABQ2CX42_9DEIO|nr:Hsp20/alpha crystallin family protein [Deinococcus roseus]GGJ29782.1 hypothetical protein GCM10008938_14770 [Deinococcus roseus]
MDELVLKRLGSLMKLREDIEVLSGTGRWTPSSDWLETDSHVILVMDLPGIDPESLEIQEDAEILTVAGKREDLEVPGTVIHHERPGTDFVREFQMPRDTMPGSAQARLRNGVLVISFEKSTKVINAE